MPLGKSHLFFLIVAWLNVSIARRSSFYHLQGERVAIIEYKN